MNERKLRKLQWRMKFVNNNGDVGIMESSVREYLYKYISFE